MYERFGLFLAGKWRQAANGATAAVISPVSEIALGEAPVATVADTQEALHAAEGGLSLWRATPAFTRADAMHAIADEMDRRAGEASRMISSETGKPLAQAQREWALTVDQFRWYAEEARRIYGRIVESRVPGSCGGLLGHRPPLVTDPGTAMVIVDCCRAGNLPSGVVNLVVGPTGATYAPIMASKAVRKVSLTGSTRVGQQMIRDEADTMKKVSMELGGNAPLIVYDDADLETALNVAVPTKYANAGQVSVTPDRFYVHESLHDAFVQGFAARTKAIKLGDGLDPTIGMGPLINASRVAAFEGIIAEAVRAGAKVVAGGGRASAFNAGHFFEPTVLTDVSDGMKVMREENFGPIAAITRFQTDDEAIERANACDMGLSAYAFTRSPTRARRTIAELKVGMVGVNSFALAASEAPFGGTNFSGMGREGGVEGIRDYLDVKLAQVVF
jgi:succinate-semialdehyde dehydrogenase / glutarate-semialdehyde dehydrogenase